MNVNQLKDVIGLFAGLYAGAGKQSAAKALRALSDSLPASNSTTVQGLVKKVVERRASLGKAKAIK
jgi:hypothetical protein